MAEIAIEATGVDKRFVRRHRAPTSLKERFVRGRGSAEEFWALREVSLDIRYGESVGLIGSNGAGKSTLLKVLAGILAPTRGTVRAHGRIASLLELGAGFNPELSGRDNVYLNASLLGLSRREVDRHFDEIVAFSELAPFIDNLVKHYSSGMYVRLGFAVAVHIDPDILLVDEVLAVGDEAFQRKCLAKIAEFQQAGRTILFVTHALDLVPQICSRGIVLNHGRVMHDGGATEAAQVLRGLLGTAAASIIPVDDVSVRIADLRMVGPGMERLGDFFPGDPLDVEVDLEAAGDTECAVQASYTGPADIPVLVMRHESSVALRAGESVTVRFRIPSLPAIQGLFALAIVLTHPDGHVQAVRRHSEALRVVGPTQSHGIVDVVYSTEVAAR